MLFREAIAAAKRNIKLQVFASDIDPDAVASAREGLYPETIEADVSPARLARFFSKEEHGYKVLPELRATVVFTVQDVLSDPPFSRLDLVSCRNLLIYLRPEAQEKVIGFSISHCARAAFCCLAVRRRSALRWPFRGNFKAGAALSAHRSRAAGMNLAFRSALATACDFPRARDKAGRPRAKPLSPSFVAGWCSRPMRRQRC